MYEQLATIRAFVAIIIEARIEVINCVNLLDIFARFWFCEIAVMCILHVSVYL